MNAKAAKTIKDTVRMAKEAGVEMLDFKFQDLPGGWQHVSAPVSQLSEALFTQGVGFDGSLLRDTDPSESSDMMLVPDPASAQIDPFYRRPTLSFICDVADPTTGNVYNHDPRSIAKRAAAYLIDTKIADLACFGPEAEFFVFDDVRFRQSANAGYYSVDSSQGAWNSGRDERPNLGYKSRANAGHFPTPPTDRLGDLRHEIVATLSGVGVEVEAEHHEVGSGGQCEIEMRYRPLLEAGDAMQWFKYVVKNVARRHDKTATFMPKPIYGDAGSGMHVHVSLWKDNEPIFAGSKYAGMSDVAMHFIGGILRHGRALTAFTNPTNNSFRRLVPGYHAPINLTYSSKTRSAAVRIPRYSANPEAKRIEFRTPDPSCNAYLAFSAILMAGLDGIQRGIDPGEPIDDIGENQPGGPNSVPASLAEALQSLRDDQAWLLKGDVFSKDLLDRWINYKQTYEVRLDQARPTPTDFELYFDV